MGGCLILNAPHIFGFGVGLIIIGLLFFVDEFVASKFPIPYRSLVLLYLGYIFILLVTYPLTNHIRLFERYAEQWQGRQGFQLPLDERHGLHHRFASKHEYKYTPGIVHEIPYITLTDVRIRVYIPDRITVVLKNETPNSWSYENARFGLHEYSYWPLANVSSGRGGAQNVTESLWFVFETPNTYTIRTEISGNMLGRNFMTIR